MMVQKLGFAGRHLICTANTKDDNAVPTIVEQDKVVIGAGSWRVTLSAQEVASIYRATYRIDWPLPDAEG